jgi:hypothetical protein
MSTLIRSAIESKSIANAPSSSPRLDTASGAQALDELEKNGLADSPKTFRQ